jgi:hypothetical protein
LDPDGAAKCPKRGFEGAQGMVCRVSLLTSVKECAYKVGKLVMDMNTTRIEKVSKIMNKETQSAKKRERRMSKMQTMEMAINEELETSILID